MAEWDPGEKKLIGAGPSSEQAMKFRITVISENQRSDKDGSREAYGYCTTIMNTLKGYKLTTMRGAIWPSAPVELLAIKNGYLAYGLEFERRFNS
jgi:hypothetical protein